MITYNYTYFYNYLYRNTFLLSREKSDENCYFFYPVYMYNLIPHRDIYLRIYDFIKIFTILFKNYIIILEYFSGICIHYLYDYFLISIYLMLFSNVGIYIEVFTNNLRTKVKKIEKFSLILQCSIQLQCVQSCILLSIFLITNK